MRYVDSIFAALLKPIDRRAFKGLVERHAADAYDKSFGSWQHLVALLYAQLSGADSLRAVVAGWNAHAHHHYHLGGGPLARSTLADANRRRPAGPFAALFESVAAQLDRGGRAEGRAMLRLLDATPIPLGPLSACATWNGRIRGLKMHLVYDPAADRPGRVEITSATVNDIAVGRTVPLEPGATYVFDKGYCHYGWWTEIAAAGACFVTRPKSNARWRVIATRAVPDPAGDGFRVLADDEVALASRGDSKLPLRLRRLRVEREDTRRRGGTVITLLTNDLQRSAVEIGALYKTRWQIELLFRWIKQHLKIKRFLGRSENAIRLQILAAMIAFALLRLAARRHLLALPALRLTELAGACLFTRKPLARIDKPPETHPHRRQPSVSPNQYAFSYV